MLRKRESKLLGKLEQAHSMRSEQHKGPYENDESLLSDSQQELLQLEQHEQLSQASSLLHDAPLLHNAPSSTKLGDTAPIDNAGNPALAKTVAAEKAAASTQQSLGVRPPLMRPAFAPRSSPNEEPPSSQGASSSPKELASLSLAQLTSIASMQEGLQQYSAAN